MGMMTTMLMVMVMFSNDNDSNKRYNTVYSFPFLSNVCVYLYLAHSYLYIKVSKYIAI